MFSNQALEEFILAEAIEIADSQLFRRLGEATNKQWMASSNEKTLNEDLLTKAGKRGENLLPCFGFSECFLLDFLKC